MENKMTENTTSTKNKLGGIEAPDYTDFTRDSDLWSEVLPGLWQGGTDDNDTLGDFVAFSSKTPFITPEHFDAVVTLYQYANPVDWLVKEYRYCIYDSDIEHFDQEALFEAVKFAHEQWVNGKRVLIRCQAGLNRSGLVTALVLIRSGFTALEAVTLIRENRNGYALFNDEFVKFLNETDPELWQGNTFAG
jgi:hypothetical protein